MTTRSTTGPAPLSRWRTWLLPEVRRTMLAAVVGVGLSIVAVGLVPDDGGAARIVLRVVSAWCLMALLHSAMTLLVFRGLTGSQLQHVLELDDSGRPQRKAGRGTRTSSGWSVELSAFSLVVVGALVLVPSLRESIPLLVVSLVMVVASWADVVAVYAVRYTHLDTLKPVIRFPGESERTFGDYLYLAVAVQTTFGATDVAIADSEARSVLTRHTLLAFAFNSVIVALLVSLLLALA